MSDATSVTVRLDALSPDESIARRTLNVARGAPVPIGRASSSESKGLVASSANAYFNCPVVSRKHAELSIKHDKDNGSPSVCITDVGSMHGTCINGIKLDKGLDHTIFDGDVLKLGCEVQRDDERYRPRKYAITFSLENFDETLDDHKSGNIEARGFEVPDSTSSEYDTNDNSDSEELSSSAAQPPSPIPSTVYSALGNHKENAMDVHSSEERSSMKEPSCAKPLGSQEHNESMVPDSLAMLDYLSEDGNPHQLDSDSEASASPSASAVPEDEPYSYLGQCSRMSEEEASDDEDPEAHYGPDVCASSATIKSNPAAFDALRASITATQKPEADTDTKASKSTDFLDTVTGGSHPSHFPSAYWPYSSSFAPKMPQVPPLPSYPAPGSTLRFPSYPKMQDDTTMNSLYPQGPNPYHPNNPYFPRGLKSSETFDAVTMAPQFPLSHPQMLGLDSDASFAAAPYRANRFDPNMSTFHPVQPVTPSDKINNVKAALNMPECQLNSPRSSSANTTQQAKKTEPVPAIGEGPLVEDAKQLDVKVQHPENTEQPKPALRISDLIDSLGSKENMYRSPVVGTKRKSFADIDSHKSSQEPGTHDNTYRQPATPRREEAHVPSPAQGRFHDDTDPLISELSEEELDDFKGSDDFDGVDDFGDLALPAMIELAKDMSGHVKDGTETKRPDPDHASQANMEPKHSEPIQANRPTESAEEPPRKRVKTNTASTKKVVQPSANRSRLSTIASAMTWTAVGSLTTLTLLANLPDTLFQ